MPSVKASIRVVVTITTCNNTEGTTVPSYLTYFLELTAMAAKKSVANLSMRGFVNNIVDLVDLLLSYFTVSNYSQTDLYYSKITSLPYLVQQFGDEPRNLVANVQTALTNMFSRYFEGALVNCDYEFIDTAANAGAYRITITITALNAEGVRVNVASELEIIDGTFREIARSNNEEPGS